MILHNLKQFGIGSAFFMVVLVGTSVAKAISMQSVMVASTEVSAQVESAQVTSTN